ncbi:MAG TPA: DUF2892 domain-containing protein [Hyphomicrobiaceae bacterium]|nr:DUF2892 domain-containing protein [Hyphomicrobiaceae bacterium]
MTANVGTIDRAVRIAVGLALLAWALGIVPGMEGSAWAWVAGIAGAVLALTAVIGVCPGYAIFGISTCGKQG